MKKSKVFLSSILCLGLLATGHADHPRQEESVNYQLSNQDEVVRLNLHDEDSHVETRTVQVPATCYREVPVYREREREVNCRTEPQISCGQYEYLEKTPVRRVPVRRRRRSNGTATVTVRTGDSTRATVTARPPRRGTPVRVRPPQQNGSERVTRAEYDRMMGELNQHCPMVRRGRVSHRQCRPDARFTYRVTRKQLCIEDAPRRVCETERYREQVGTRREAYACTQPQEQQFTIIDSLTDAFIELTLRPAAEAQGLVSSGVVRARVAGRENDRLRVTFDNQQGEKLLFLGRGLQIEESNSTIPVNGQRRHAQKTDLRMVGDVHVRHFDSFFSPVLNGMRFTDGLGQPAGETVNIVLGDLSFVVGQIFTQPRFVVVLRVQEAGNGRILHDGLLSPRDYVFTDMGGRRHREARSLVTVSLERVLGRNYQQGMAVDVTVSVGILVNRENILNQRRELRDLDFRAIELPVGRRAGLSEGAFLDSTQRVILD